MAGAGVDIHLGGALPSGWRPDGTGIPSDLDWSQPSFLFLALHLLLVLTMILHFYGGRTP